MAFTLADKYFLKALEVYDYDLEEVVDNLNYALSYDPDHSGAAHLMGKVYVEQFRDFEKAEMYFEESIASEPSNIQACESLTWLLIDTRRYEDALKLIKYTSTLPASKTDVNLRMQALVLELIEDYEGSIASLNSAIQRSCSSSYISFLECEKARVESKAANSNRISYRFQGE